MSYSRVRRPAIDDHRNENPVDRAQSTSKQPGGTRSASTSSLRPLSTLTNLPPKPSPPTSGFPDSSCSLSSPLSLSVDPRQHSLPSLEEKISMSLSGVSFSYDLVAMKSDAHEVIELLKVTSSERGIWLHVAAFYRRSSNPRSAISVIHAMLEVMSRKGIPETKLKPAYLLLSGCETDLAKEARKESKDPSTHYKNAQTWLQKVYGTFNTDLRPKGTSKVAEAPNNSAFAQPTSDPPSEPQPRPSTVTAEDIDKPTILPPQQQQVRTSGQERIMQREIQSLRDRLENQRNLLADVRSSKRKLEDDLEDERNYRRRLERQVDDLLRERDDAREVGYEHGYRYDYGHGHGGYY